MGLTQLQAAEKLHVDAKVVDSLEAERYEVLGAPVFVRGHLKRYAELIGEQPFQLLDLYTASTQPAAPDLTRLPKVTRSSKPSRLAVPALLVLIAFVMIGVIWWIVQSVNKPGRSDSASAAHEVSTEPAAITPDADGTAPDAASASFHIGDEQSDEAVEIPCIERHRVPGWKLADLLTRRQPTHRVAEARIAGIVCHRCHAAITSAVVTT
jgi:cytoskeleton protein RodZ